MIDRKVVKALPSSFVASNMKLATDRGSGEAKLWVGQTSNIQELDDFFGFNEGYRYSFSKDNLLAYLNQMKVEYIYQKFNHYKNTSLDTWEENYNLISTLEESDFTIHLVKFTDTNRYYVRAEEDIFKKTFRRIAVPKLTNVVFEKDSDKRNIIIKLELNLEYEKDSNDDNFADDVLNHNLYGIHMKEKNTALSDDNPHICIGWSRLGNLSSLSTKEELADLYSREWPEAKSKTRGQNVGQVWRFVDEMQIGDYVVFADGNVFHIGRIESEYYYDESVDENQSPDYKNTRKVEWLKKDIQRSEVSAALHRSLMTAMSVWTMNDYRAAIADLLNGTYVSDEEYVEESEDSLQIKYKTGYKSDFAMNRIIFGAPGTGKSYTINKEAKLLIGEDNETDYERVTFHPDYSYANFVGTYKPVMVGKGRQFSADPDTDYVVSVLNDKGKSAQEKYDMLFERFRGDGLTRLPVLLGLYTDEIFKTRKQDGTDAAGDNSVERNHGRAIRKYVKLIDGQEEAGDIAYEYVPGPFMRVYVNALKNARTDNPKPYLLIIEEINRANVAAVFGDVFQLLDRNDDNVSEYPIQASEDIKKYLAKELGGTPDDYTKIRIPDNMFIWATMNSADQGVFPMDTAFKRRWDFTYLGIDDSDTDIRGKYVEVGSKYKQRIEWNSLRKAINDFLAAEKINEDKQLGPYFISMDIVVPADDGNTIDSKRFCNVFKHKVLMYLFDDAAKQKRMKLFGGFHGDALRYSEICKEFDEQGIGIFNSSIQSQVNAKDLVTNDHELDENGLPKIDE